MREALGADVVVRGAIVDSWVEPSGSPERAARLVLQVAPRERPHELMLVEAAASLVADRSWLADLGENLCHGSPVSAVGRLNRTGRLQASQLLLDR